MSKPIEVIDSPYTKVYGPLVRYADHCAAMAAAHEDFKEMDRLRANAVRRCVEWEKEVERLSNLLTDSVRRGHAVADAIGRWDGPLKAL